MELKNAKFSMEEFLNQKRRHLCVSQQEQVLQQVAEGFLWLTLQNNDHLVLQQINTYVYLVVADVLWPVLIPLSILLMEENEKRRKVIRIFFINGILVSLYYGVCLMLFSVTPVIMNCHIHYGDPFIVRLMLPAFLLFVTATITPLFISTVKRMYIMGLMMFAGCVVAVIFYAKNVTSVWCFFAAVISVIIYWILSGATVQRHTGAEAGI
jgi:hypothetical protein